ncbi:hypothetical protein AB205_0019970 [Aquarana catesbeiana]|uniref:Uncharacterized protein n=1 Tax=Aquarana catesbeiana TaxID=8400 RepID=A0A2G9R4W3_AQUCT|nr:hypothetical protein AB205_0019970 [Aquarana catesbeiana]
MEDLQIRHIGLWMMLSVTSRQMDLRNKPARLRNRKLMGNLFF